jgi:hypothetical protein
VSELVPLCDPQTGPPVVPLVLVRDGDGRDQCAGLGILLHGGELGRLVGEVAEEDLRRVVVGVQQQHLHCRLRLLDKEAGECSLQPRRITVLAAAKDLICIQFSRGTKTACDLK